MTAVVADGKANNTTASELLAVAPTVGKDAKTAVLSDAITLYNGSNADSAIFTINGKKFVVADSGQDVSGLGKDVEVLTTTTSVDTGGSSLAK